MAKHMKILCPEIQRMMALFRMQRHMESKTHAELLKRVEIAVASGGVGSKEGFELNYDKLIVRITISLFPENSRQALASKFNGFDITREELKEWCNGQTIY